MLQIFIQQPPHTHTYTTSFKAVTTLYNKFVCVIKSQPKTESAIHSFTNTF